MNLYIPSFRGNSPYTFEYLDAIYGDKNVYTTVTDLKRYDSAIHNRVLLDSSSYALAWQPWYKDGQHRDSHEYYGLGWRLKVWPDGIKKVVYHNGWWHGNNSCFQRLIMDTAVIIVTGNRYNTAIYKAGRAANIFRNYYDEAGAEDTEEGGVVDTTNAAKELQIHERRGRHSATNREPVRAKEVRSSSKSTKAKKVVKSTKQKAKVTPKKRKR